jgi:hypothetical protein
MLLLLLLRTLGGAGGAAAFLLLQKACMAVRFLFSMYQLPFGVLLLTTTAYELMCCWQLQAVVSMAWQATGCGSTSRQRCTIVQDNTNWS